MLSCKNKNTLERPFFAQLDMKTNVVCCMGSLFQIQQSDFHATFLGHPSTQYLRVLTSPASQQSTMRRARASQRARSSQSRITSATPEARSCSAASALFPVREYGYIYSIYRRRARASQRARSCAIRFGAEDVWRIEEIRNLYQYMLRRPYITLTKLCHSNIHPPNYPLCPDT